MNLQPSLAHSQLQRDVTFTELRTALLAGMQLALVRVPGYAMRPGPTGAGDVYVETERPYVEELINTLDHVEPLEQFLRVLKDSECPIVAKLRLTLADVYARTMVDGLVKARSAA